MSKPEWGTKRICQACQAKYYDLNREPGICPKCHAAFDPTAGLKSQPRGFGAMVGRPKSVFDKGASPEIEEAAVETEADEEEDEDGEPADDVPELDDEDGLEVIEEIEH